MITGWQQRTLGECATLVRDTVSPLVVPDYPYIGLEHIEPDTLTLLEHGVGEDVSSVKAKFCRDDILFGRLRPYFRKVIRAPLAGICSTDIWVVRAREGVDGIFLFYCMASQEFVDFVSGGSIGTRMPRAKWEHASQYQLELPPLPEQRSIGHVLKTIDEQIRLNRQMNGTLERMARALFKSWFVDFDPVHARITGHWRRGQSFPGFPAELYDLFPDCLVDSELGPIPKGWKLGTLGQLCQRPQYGYTQSANKDPVGPKFLRITDINKTPWIEWESVPHCETTPEDFEKYRVHPGDVLIARMADPGHGCMIEHRIKAVFASYLIRFRPLQERYGRFLQYWLRSEGYWNLVQERGVGTTRLSLNARVLSGFPLIIPGDSVLDAFRVQIDRFRSRIVNNSENSNTLRNLRDALLPKLLAGELTVKL